MIGVFIPKSHFYTGFSKSNRMINSIGISETEEMVWVCVAHTAGFCVSFEAPVEASQGCLQFGVLGEAQLHSHIQDQFAVVWGDRLKR